MNADHDNDRRKARRQPLNTEVEFVVDADVINAEGVDVSEQGIAFDVAEAVPILLQLQIGGELVRRRARLIRVVKRNGRFRLGLEFDD